MQQVIVEYGMMLIGAESERLERKSTSMFNTANQ
ncbi:hypothetical protein JOC76_002419 [Neobacillus cucumis]|nr:hypothetical protein [Neobacillus cucumis]